MENSPRLRTVDKIQPPYPLNKFPDDFGFKVGREIVYLLATKGKAALEGPEWEEIFANCIGAIWKPSNVGLDDVVLDVCAWGTKTVKAGNPSIAKTVRLISGRNSIVYSFGESDIGTTDPNRIGGQVLSIWNERVSSIRKKHKHLRTVVLMKSNTLSEVAVFEFDTIRYDTDLYDWRWNRNKNLEGFEKNNNKHRFTWQPHGSQFTIKEDVPDECLIINIKQPSNLNKDIVLKGLGFNNEWITVTHKKKS
ncbi:MAG: hypothetical protein HQL01_00510 [Nitrospirae bacterium]|nr:hypothetical protein [Nitrospirota bacterium]